MAIEFKSKSAAEIVADLRKIAPAAETKTAKSNRRIVAPAERKEVSKPVVDELQKKIEAIATKPAKKSGRGRPKSADHGETEVLSIRLDKDIVDKVKANKNWQQIMKTIIYHEFDG